MRTNLLCCGAGFTELDFNYGLHITDSQTSDRLLNSSIAQSSLVLDYIKNMIQDAKKDMFKRRNPKTGGGPQEKLEDTTEIVLKI